MRSIECARILDHRQKKRGTQGSRSIECCCGAEVLVEMTCICLGVEVRLHDFVEGSRERFCALRYRSWVTGVSY